MRPTAFGGFSNFRIYAQLKPDQPSLNHLTDLQHGLPQQQKGRPVPVRQLHMTLIHFGKVHDVYRSISNSSPLSYEKYTSLLTEYIADTEELIPSGKFKAEPIGFADFGQRGGTLAVEYRVPDVLMDIHAELFNVLKKFLRRCGISNLNYFLENDRNFMNAGKLRPHITLYKGYEGPPPVNELQYILLLPMPAVYPLKVSEAKIQGF